MCRPCSDSPLFPLLVGAQLVRDLGMAIMATALDPGQVKQLLAAAGRHIAAAEAAVGRLEPGERWGGTAPIACPLPRNHPLLLLSFRPPAWHRPLCLHRVCIPRQTALRPSAGKRRRRAGAVRRATIRGGRAVAAAGAARRGGRTGAAGRAAARGGWLQR